jgi:hypothetical protein
MAGTGQAPQVAHPAGYVTQQVLALGAPGELAQPISEETPLPTAGIVRPSGVTPLSGTAGEDALIGPFAPILGRPITLTLSGLWSGTVQVMRSIDAGATYSPVTLGGDAWGVFRANVNEPIWEETEDGATFYLDIRPLSGTVTYRFAQ